MLTREEIIGILGADECYTDQFGGDERLILRRPIAIRIIELLKQQPEKPERKPEQLLSIFNGHDYNLVAICTDGTMWRVEGKQGWVQIESIPQDDDNAN